jgi:hypothetical protein
MSRAVLRGDGANGGMVEMLWHCLETKYGEKPWDDKGRILDLPSPGMFGGAMSSGPDDSCDVPFTAIEEKPGMWRITPKGELMPGEYGMFRWEGDTSLTQASSRLHDFGIDK